jgi:hypothetical protein
MSLDRNPGPSSSFLLGAISLIYHIGSPTKIVTAEIVVLGIDSDSAED